MTASESLTFSGNPSDKCKIGTVAATGNFTTNGVAGTVSYQWRHFDSSGALVNDGGTVSGSIAVKAGTTSYTFTSTLTPQTNGSEQLVFTAPGYTVPAQTLGCRA